MVPAVGKIWPDVIKLKNIWRCLTWLVGWVDNIRSDRARYQNKWVRSDRAPSAYFLSHFQPSCYLVFCFNLTLSCIDSSLGRRLASSAVIQLPRPVFSELPSSYIIKLSNRFRRYHRQSPTYPSCTISSFFRNIFLLSGNIFSLWERLTIYAPLRGLGTPAR